jgi:hypothetical protein
MQDWFRASILLLIIFHFYFRACQQASDNSAQDKQEVIFTGQHPLYGTPVDY